MARQRDPAFDLADPRLTRVARAIMSVLLATRDGRSFGQLDWPQICARHRAGEDEVSVFFDAAEAAINAVYDS